MSLTAEIKEYALQIGVDVVGVARVEPFPQLKKFLTRMEEKNYLSKFVPRDFDLITDPTRVVPAANSAIVCAISYQVADEYITPRQEQAAVELRGELSRFAWGRDYHQVLGAKLDQIIDFLDQQAGQVVAEKFVDTGPLVDRELARRAGIGWQGKNGSIINPEYGSWIFLGEIITNLDLQPDEALTNQCGTCTKCLDACPMGALVEPYQLDSGRCLGYLTLSKGYLEEQTREKMGRRLWGCDTCQEVCPYNQSARVGNHPEFRPQKLAAYPYLPPLVNLTEEEYQEQFSITPMNWRGKRPIQRNAAVILGNLADERGVPYLTEALQDSKPIVRAHAAWALGKIGNGESQKQLNQQLEQETDEQVRREIQQAQKQL